MNMAKLQNNGYVSCFADNKVLCKVAPDSLISKGHNSNILMFYEIFQSSSDIKSCKLNMVNMVPRHILDIVKQRISKHIAYCI